MQRPFHVRPDQRVPRCPCLSPLLVTGFLSVAEEGHQIENKVTGANSLPPGLDRRSRGMALSRADLGELGTKQRSPARARTSTALYPTLPYPNTHAASLPFSLT